MSNRHRDDGSGVATTPSTVTWKVTVREEPPSIFRLRTVMTPFSSLGPHAYSSLYGLMSKRPKSAEPGPMSSMVQYLPAIGLPSVSVTMSCGR